MHKDAWNLVIKYMYKVNKIVYIVAWLATMLQMCYKT